MSSDVAAIVAKAEETFGALVANHHEYETLYRAIRSGEHAYELVPSVLSRMIRQGSWMNRLDPNLSRHTKLRATQFLNFIGDQPPIGLGSTVDQIRIYLGDNTPARIDFDLAVNRGAGAPIGNTNNVSGLPKPREDNPIRDNVTDWVADENQEQTLPLPKRGRSVELNGGNSTDYAARRLARERPDLLERVKARELSPHKAMIEAGFRLPMISLPAEPRRAGRLLAKHFTPAQFDQLARAYREARGDAS